VIGDYVYLFGGQTTGSVDTSAIYRASLANPTVWSKTSQSLPVAISDSQVVIVGDYVYLLGGFSSTAIYRAPVADPTSWTTTGYTVAAGATTVPAVIVGDYVYTFGTTIYRAPISSNAGYNKTLSRRTNTPASQWFTVGTSSTALAYTLGNVGIGTSSPSAFLSLNLSTTTNGSFNNLAFLISSSTATFSTTTLFSIPNTTAGTSTFATGLSANYLNITGAAATSTFARGIDLAGGCFSIGGVCVGGSSGSTFGFPFTTGTFGATAANATSTLIGFTTGLYATASSTIGDGTQKGGLTVAGGATTTGNLLVQGNATSMAPESTTKASGKA
jgi:hypothetical protein